MLRRAAAAVLAAAVSSAGGCELLAPDFQLSGEVELAPELAERAPRVNAALFVVAANEGGVPLAVHRIVNPVFPAAFRMGLPDLLVPRLGRRERLLVRAEMNASGAAGAPRPGDLAGPAEPARPGARGLRLRLDRVVP